MREFFAGLFVLVIVIIVALFLGVGGARFDLWVQSWYLPAQEQIRHETMTHSRAYDEATVRELYVYKRQYLQATSDAEKTTIKLAALHEFEIFPKDQLPDDLRVWMEQLENQ